MEVKENSPSFIAKDGIEMPNPDFPGGALVKNPPANAEDTGCSPGPVRSHMPRRN